MHVYFNIYLAVFIEAIYIYIYIHTLHSAGLGSLVALPLDRMEVVVVNLSASSWTTANLMSKKSLSVLESEWIPFK